LLSFRTCVVVSVKTGGQRRRGGGGGGGGGGRRNLGFGIGDGDFPFLFSLLHSPHALQEKRTLPGALFIFHLAFRYRLGKEHEREREKSNFGANKMGWC